MFEQDSLLKCLIRPLFEQKETATYQHTAGTSQSLHWLICCGPLHLAGSYTHTHLRHAGSHKDTLTDSVTKTSRRTGRRHTHTPSRFLPIMHLAVLRWVQRSTQFTLIRLTMTFPLCSRCRSPWQTAGRQGSHNLILCSVFIQETCDIANQSQLITSHVCDGWYFQCVILAKCGSDE